MRTGGIALTSDGHKFTITQSTATRPNQKGFKHVSFPLNDEKITVDI